MRSHGILHSNHDLAQSIQQHSIFLWVSQLSQGTSIIDKIRFLKHKYSIQKHKEKIDQTADLRQQKAKFQRI